METTTPVRPVGAAILGSLPRRFQRLWTRWSAAGLHSRQVAAVLMASAVALVALLTVTTRLGEPDLGVYAASEGSGDLRITWVIAGGYGAEAGMRPGDLVREIPVPAGQTGSRAFQVLEGARAGQTLVITRRWAPTIDAALFVLGLEFLLAGILVWLRAGDRVAARRFAAMSTAVAATLVGLPAVGDGVPWALAWEWIGSKAGMAAFAYFFLTYPVARWRRLRLGLVLAPAFILAAYAYVISSRPDLYGVFKLAGYSYMAAGATASVAALLWPFVTGAPASQRRLRPVAVGAGAGALLYLLGSLLPYLLFRQYLIPAELAIMGIGLLPVCLMWSVMRYPIMGISLNSSAVLRAFFESTSDPMFVVDGNGRLIGASLAGRSLFDLDAKPRAGGGFCELFAGLEARREGETGHVAAVVREALSGGIVHDAEVALRMPGGYISHFSVDGTPLPSESGAHTMAVIVLRDITPRKQREIARQELERQKDEFLAAVSHDLRTPLAAIKYSIGVVLANCPEDFPDPLSRMLKNVDQAADTMSSQVADLLDLASLQAGQVQLRPAWTDLREPVRRSAAAVQPLAGSREQRINLDLPSTACWGMVDQARLERAITNLVVNAHKHGRQGGSISLGIARSATEIRISISDDGPGISLEEQARIFDRFYRCGRPDLSGIGLGLPIAKGMVELHGGSLGVESSPGAGATFYISLPVVPVGEQNENPGSR